MRILMGEEGQAAYARLSSSSEIARTTACASSAKSSYVGARTTVGRFSPEYFLCAEREKSRE